MKKILCIYFALALLSVPSYVQASCPELEITQDLHQDGFDDYSTTDDHGIHIYGKAKDQNGIEYHMVKNSWENAGLYIKVFGM